MNKKAKYIIYFLLFIILILSLVIIFKRKQIMYNIDNEQPLKDSLFKISQRLILSERKVDSLNNKYDSLLNVEKDIIFKDRDKIKFIYTTATPFQLDSIIRTAWSLRHY